MAPRAPCLPGVVGMSRDDAVATYGGAGYRVATRLVPAPDVDVVIRQQPDG